MKKNKIRSTCKQCASALALTLLLSALLACGDETSSSKDESDMVTTETNSNIANQNNKETHNQDLGTGGNQTATENNSSLNSDEQTNTDGVADDIADGANDVVNGVSDGVSDVVDGIADGVNDVTDGTNDDTNNTSNRSRMSQPFNTTK